MTWDELMRKVREGLGESAARIQALGDLLPDVSKGNGLLDYAQTNIAVIGLVLAVSDLHSTVEHMSIGLDAVVEAMREASKTQEVKGD